MSTLTGTSAGFALDTKAPQGLSNFDAVLSAVDAATLTWTAATDTNFNHYEIWYGTNQSDVQNRTGTASEWDDGDDANLATVTTNSTTVTGLSSSVIYYFAIWGIDDYGNETARVDSASVVDTTITKHDDGDGDGSNGSGLSVQDKPDPFNARVIIPSGAIPSGAGTVTISVVEQDTPNPVPTSRRSVLALIGQDEIAYTYSVTGDLTFDSAVTIRMLYDPVKVASHNVSEEDLRIFKWNGSTWIPLETTVNTVDNYAQAFTTSFSDHDLQGDPHPPICWNFTAAYQE